MSKIKYGKAELADDEFDPRHTKFRVNMWIPLDVLDRLRDRAKKERMPYQMYINKVLRTHVYSGIEGILSLSSDEGMDFVDAVAEIVKKKIGSGNKPQKRKRA